MRLNVTARYGLFVGDDKGLSFEVFDASNIDPAAYETDQAYYDAIVAAGVMVDVAGFALRFDLRKGASANDPSLLTKATSSGISITGTYNVARAVNTQRVLVTLEDTDTNTLPPKDYQYALKRTDAGFET